MRELIIPNVVILYLLLRVFFSFYFIFYPTNINGEGESSSIREYVHQHTLMLAPTQSGVENVGGVAKIVFYILSVVFFFAFAFSVYAMLFRES